MPREPLITDPWQNERRRKVRGLALRGGPWLVPVVTASESQRGMPL